MPAPGRRVAEATRLVNGRRQSGMRLARRRWSDECGTTWTRLPPSQPLRPVGCPAPYSGGIPLRRPPEQHDDQKKPRASTPGCIPAGWAQPRRKRLRGTCRRFRRRRSAPASTPPAQNLRRRQPPPEPRTRKCLRRRVQKAGVGWLSSSIRHDVEGIVFMPLTRYALAAMAPRGRVWVRSSKPRLVV